MSEEPLKQPAEMDHCSDKPEAAAQTGDKPESAPQCDDKSESGSAPPRCGDNSERADPPCGTVGTKPGGFDLWRGRLRAARLVVAPMVDQSETAWRMLSRKYGAELCYTPMYHANVFVKDVKYRRECLTTYPEDRPLVIQFCCNNPATLLEAARFCQGGQFDALDINLGCPQSIARRGHYGAFLQDEWELVSRLVKVVHEETDLPVTCKIRIFDDLDKTIRYARMLELAGCQLLTIHGRTREMKGPLTGLADWDAIRAVREAVSIPVFANGNIQYLADVHRCLQHTGAQGVMSAEGNLHNPAMFAGRHPPVWEAAELYLQLVRRYPCPLSYARGHVFKMLHYCLLMPANHDVRSLVARASRLEQLDEAVQLLRQRYQQYTEPAGPAWSPGPGDEVVSRLPMSPLLCQPHEREPIAEHLKKMEANAEKQRLQRQQQQQQQAEDGEQSPTEAKRPRTEDPTVISKRKLKKMARGVKVGVNRVTMERCSLCCNPRGQRCEFLLCRLHCRNRCYEENLDCPGHRILVRTRRENARLWSSRQPHENGAKPGDGRTENGGAGDGSETENGGGEKQGPATGGVRRKGKRKGEEDRPCGSESSGGPEGEMDSSRAAEMDSSGAAEMDSSGAAEMDSSGGAVRAVAPAVCEDSAMDSSEAVVR